MNKKFYVNGKIADERRLMTIKPGDTVFITDDTPVGNPQGTAVIEEDEGKKTLKEKIASLPWWQKAGAIIGAIAGGAYIANKLAPVEPEDEEDEDETEEDDESEDEEMEE